MKKVLFIIASEGFQMVEYETPKAVLEKAGIEVVTVSDGAGNPNGAPLGAVASSGEKVRVDLTCRDALQCVSTGDYDGLFFVGGEGALEHLDNEMVYDLLKKWANPTSSASGGLRRARPYGAICISPRILAHAGVLQGKKATGWNGDGELQGILSAGGAEFVDQPVVVDENVVTGNGPGAAGEWGEEIVRLLTKT